MSASELDAGVDLTSSMGWGAFAYERDRDGCGGGGGDGGGGGGDEKDGQFNN